MPDATIVVVEDEENIRELVEAMLQAGGYRVASTGEPEKAHALVAQVSPQLVLCDLAMPGMDGYGVLRSLQQDPQTASIPVVFLTANHEISERVRAFKFGVVDYVTKPFAREELLARVGLVLGSLQARPGIATGSVGSLVAEAERERRSGVLSVTGPEGRSHHVVQSGRILDGLPDLASAGEFRELDPGREAILVHDPTRLPVDFGPLPTLEGLPAQFRSILVVQENPFFARFLKDLLSSFSFTVYEAATGDEGLRLALARRPWLILTDMHLPGLDGLELCRSIRSHSLIRHTPIVFLSGWDDYAERLRGLEAGADEYLSKQTPVRELLIRIQLILKRYFEVQTTAPGRSGMEGRIEVMGTSGLLQICHLSRLSGLLTVRSGAQALEVTFSEGEILAARRGGLSGVPAIHDFLVWTSGHFDFVPGASMPGETLGGSFEHVLLEGCRLLDEKLRHSREEGSPVQEIGS